MLSLSLLSELELFRAAYVLLLFVSNFLLSLQVWGGSFLGFRTISVIDISTLALYHDVSVKRIWGSVEARVI